MMCNSLLNWLVHNTDLNNTYPPLIKMEVYDNSLFICDGAKNFQAHVNKSFNVLLVEAIKTNGLQDIEW